MNKSQVNRNYTNIITKVNTLIQSNLKLYLKKKELYIDSEKNKVTQKAIKNLLKKN